MMACIFCRDYNTLVEANNESDTRPGLIFCHKTVYEVALVSKGKRKTAAEKRWHDNGTTSYHGYKLKYCPECGKMV